MSMWSKFFTYKSYWISYIKESFYVIHLMYTKIEKISLDVYTVQCTVYHHLHYWY